MPIYRRRFRSRRPYRRTVRRRYAFRSRTRRAPYVRRTLRRALRYRRIGLRATPPTVKCVREVLTNVYALTYIGTGAYPGNGAVALMPDIPIGTADNQREGRSVRVLSLHTILHFSIINANDYAQAAYSLFQQQGFVEVNTLILRWKRMGQYYQSANTIAYPAIYRFDGDTVYVATNGLSTTADLPVDKDNYDVLYRRRMRLAMGDASFGIANTGNLAGESNNANPQVAATMGLKIKRLKFRLNKRIDYNGTSRYPENENIALFCWATNPYTGDDTDSSFYQADFAPVRLAINTSMYYTDI